MRQSLRRALLQFLYLTPRTIVSAQTTIPFTRMRKLITQRYSKTCLRSLSHEVKCAWEPIACICWLLNQSMGGIRYFGGPVPFSLGLCSQSWEMHFSHSSSEAWRLGLPVLQALLGAKTPESSLWALKGTGGWAAGPQKGLWGGSKKWQLAQTPDPGKSSIRYLGVCLTFIWKSGPASMGSPIGVMHC